MIDHTPALASLPCRTMRRKTHLDANGCVTEVVKIGGQKVVVTYDDVPESDVTTVQGIRCTTPLRTVIDLAVELQEHELERIIDDCLARALFTLEQAAERLVQSDMTSRPGARILRDALARRDGWPLSA